MVEKEVDIPRLDRLLRAEEVVVQVLEVTKDWAQVRLWPRVDAVRSILEEDDTAACTLPYSVRHYTCGRSLFCSIGLYHEKGKDRVYRDACAISAYHVTGDAAQDECDSSFLAAASLWDVGLPVLRMPSIRVGADRVQINPIADPGGQRIKGYVLADTLNCTGLAIEDGAVTLVQLTNGRGDNIVWRRR